MLPAFTPGEGYLGLGGAHDDGAGAAEGRQAHRAGGLLAQAQLGAGASHHRGHRGDDRVGGGAEWRRGGRCVRGGALGGRGLVNARAGHAGAGAMRLTPVHTAATHRERQGPEKLCGSREGPED